MSTLFYIIFNKFLVGYRLKKNINYVKIILTIFLGFKMLKLKDKTKFYTALIIFSLTGQIAWVVENMYFNVYIYKMFNASANDISTMVAVSAVVAALTTIFMGALSDKLGSRKKFISIGYIVWGITICLFSLIRVDVISKIFPTVSAMSFGVTLVIIMDGVMTFFGSTANDACFNAWLTDSSNSQNRGKVEGLNSMMPLVAILVVFGGFMSFDLGKASSWTAIFLIIGIAVIIIGIIGIFIIKEPVINKAENVSYFKNLLHGFTPKVIKQNKNFYLTLIAFAIFNISIQIFMPYLILYYEVSLSMDNYVLIMAPAIIVASVVTALYGKFYDKFGFTKSIISPIASLILGYVLLFIFKNVALVFIGSLFMMSGYLTGMGVFGAKIRDLTPENKSGSFQGLRIIGQVLIPGVIGPFIGSAVLKNADTIVGNDGTVSFVPNVNIFIAALVVAVVLIGYLSLYFFVFNKKSKHQAVNNG